MAERGAGRQDDDKEKGQKPDAPFQGKARRRGTTWRLLPPSVQAGVKDEKSAIAVMLEKPSAIKRPVLENPGPRLIGFDEKTYAKL